MISAALSLRAARMGEPYNKDMSAPAREAVRAVLNDIRELSSNGHYLGSVELSSNTPYASIVFTALSNLGYSVVYAQTSSKVTVSMDYRFAKLLRDFDVVPRSNAANDFLSVAGLEGPRSAKQYLIKCIKTYGPYAFAQMLEDRIGSPVTMQSNNMGYMLGYRLNNTHVYEVSYEEINNQGAG